MMRQLELFAPEDMSRGNTPARSAEMLDESGYKVRWHLTEELEAAAERVRAGLNKMRATHAEIGRELWAVKKRLTRGQFLSWVGLACGLSLRTARSMMRIAELARFAASPPSLERSHKLKPRVVRDMMRAVKGPTAFRPKEQRTAVSALTRPAALLSKTEPGDQK